MGKLLRIHRALNSTYINHRVVWELVRYEERGFDVTAVSVFAAFVEDFVERLLVTDIDCIVERQDDHLRNFLWNIK